MRPYQKVSLVVGCVWLLMMTMGFMDVRDSKSLSTALTTTLLPVAILWLSTGTLKHVIDWFKSK